MSFKIFTLQLFGGLKPVEAIEKKRKELLDDYVEFQKVENSEELQKYLSLEKEVSSDEFKRKKAEIEALQFKGSKEFNQLAEFTALQKKKTIRNYFKISSSQELEKFNKLKTSDKLAEFNKLMEYVKEGQFEKDKKEILGQVFKGSVEEKHLKDFKKLDKSTGIRVYKEIHHSDQLKKHELFSKSDKLKTFLELGNVPNKDKQKSDELKRLQNDSEIKNYFKFEKSKKLKLYRETADSQQLLKYNELKSFIESDEFKKREVFLKDKSKFEKSEANKKYRRYKELAADTDIKFFFKFEKSSLYKNYLDVEDSFDLKRYNELLAITTSEEFKERKKYLEDKKKWEKTDEFARQQQFLEMKKLPHLVKYFKNKGTTVFKFFNEWTLVFEDDFSSGKLDQEKWATKGFVADKLLGDNYALSGDKSIFTDGKNIRLNGKMSIDVKREKVQGKLWQMPAGFIPAELDYTSGIVSSWKSFRMEDGILEAKIKFDPIQEIVSSFYLAGEQEVPRVNVIEMGAKNRVGVLNKNNAGKADVNGMDISNLKKGKWYIFSLVKEGQKYTWKINESEILTVQNSDVKGKLSVNASSIVVDDVPGNKLPSGFEIDWVKCYLKN